MYSYCIDLRGWGNKSNKSSHRLKNNCFQFQSVIIKKKYAIQSTVMVLHSTCQSACHFMLLYISVNFLEND